MSESVASALEFLDNDCTKQFIRMIDRFFDYMNVKSPLHECQSPLIKTALLDSIAPYRCQDDERFKVCSYK